MSAIQTKKPTDKLSVRRIAEEEGLTLNEADAIFRKVQIKYGSYRIPGHRRVWVTREHYDQFVGRNQVGSDPSEEASGGTT